MYYGYAGEMLVVNAFYDTVHQRYFDKLEAEPAYVTAYTVGGKHYVRIPHGTLVLALESSVPPWYESDRIRCLWEERVVFIRRKALEKVDACSDP